MRRKLAAGNWKMHGTVESLPELAGIAGCLDEDGAEGLICLPATLLSRGADAVRGTLLEIGGQDCHAAAKGAHTGDVSAAMVRDAGASHVILGHSERRGDHGETDATVFAKTRAAWDAGLVAIVCVGETEAQRDAGQTLDVIAAQLAGSVPAGATAETTVIAYEPVWAIGTGRTPTTDQIAQVHDFLRAALAEKLGTGTANGIRLLYGGSVKPDNAPAIFAVSNVDGALVGGASLKAADFGGICAALNAA